MEKGKIRKDKKKFRVAKTFYAARGDLSPQQFFCPQEMGKGHARFSYDWSFQSFRKSAEGLGMVHENNYIYRIHIF